MKYCVFKGVKIAFTDQGKGKCIVLLHGFPETSGIWKKFSARLSAQFRVITVDLPGFGNSGNLAAVHTMELMADAVRGVLSACRVRKCLVTGHSMGGYVTLAFAEKYPALLKGICLFHSHPYADSSEVRQNRDRTVKVLEKDRFGFVAGFLPDLFAPDLRIRYKKEIEALVAAASRLTPEALIAATLGMKERPDSVKFLKNTTIPVLFIVGMKDTRVPLARLTEMLLMPGHSESLILQDIGHMGFIEAFPQTLDTLTCFARKVL
jgi:pimeloyl-ACP methyl ester carboxylesterase